MNALNPVLIVNAFRHDMDRVLLIPFPLRIAFKGLTLTHWIWWFFRKKNVYVNPQNFLPLAAGHLLNMTVGEGWIRTGAKLLLIATRLDECREKTLELMEAGKKLSNCLIKKRYLLQLEPKWSKKGQSSLQSPHFRNSWYIFTNNTYFTMHRIYICAKRVFVRFAELGMHTWDAYDALTVGNDALPEVFINGFRWMDKLSNNKDYFLEKMKTHKPLIEKILISMHSPLKFDEIIAGMDVTLKTTAVVSKIYHKVCQKTGETFVDFGKRSLLGLFATFNKAQWIPDRFLPAKEPSNPAIPVL